ncbi:Ppx/GppA phosphatase family protein [Terriglobus aquaticus]|uniref:Ppx/GppA phosphatase family protein n=1 Tax=Terriglobus aquaticus TaxID=940139 RepID=A0ABW9KJM9_9BACT|nr:Ppx/GppA phosphatase family protein [Terriglobus aquaticus]
MPKFAAIDIGSNSCRLAIAEVQQHKLHMLHEDREVVRLGESVFETGLISPDAMATTIRALKRFQKAVQTQVVDRVRVVATSAMRDAQNASAFTAWVKSELGWNVEVISGLEEGRLIHLGVTTHEPGARGRCLLIDLGGGSCEITLSENGRVQEMVSLPLGSVRLQQEFLHTDPPSREEQNQLRTYIDRELRKLERKFGPQAPIPLVIATSGSAAALAEASTVLAESKPAKSKGKTLIKLPARKPRNFAAHELRSALRLEPLTANTPTVRALAAQLVTMTNEQRMAVPGIGPKRSEIIIGGAFVYAELLERLKLSGFRYSPLGLRDGILAQMLADVDNRASVHRAIEQERWNGVLEICKRYAVDMKRAEPVRNDVTRLFDDLQRVHTLSPEFREWLAAAAMMQGVGRYVSHQGHHRHTHYLIANSEMFGFSPAQRALVAAIARYMGKSRPVAMDKPMRAVPVELHTSVMQSVALLRLAVALNQDLASDPVRFTSKVYPKRVLLQLQVRRGSAELERWALRKESAYFREVFRRDLDVELA